MTQHKHIPTYCSILDCEEEATTFICDYTTHRVGTTQTFYLCEDHNDQLVGSSEDSGVINILRDEGYISKHELGVYSCDENCDVCN